MDRRHVIKTCWWSSKMMMMMFSLEFPLEISREMMGWTWELQSNKWCLVIIRRVMMYSVHCTPSSTSLLHEYYSWWVVLSFMNIYFDKSFDASASEYQNILSKNWRTHHLFQKFYIRCMYKNSCEESIRLWESLCRVVRKSEKRRVGERDDENSPSES